MNIVWNPRKFVASLKTLLKRADISPAELAEMLEMKKRTIQSWVAGTSLPSDESITDFRIRAKATLIELDKASAALESFLSYV